jgi:hypothetical protein
VWGVGPVRVYLGASLVWAAGLYGFSSFPGSVLAGTIEMVEGGAVFLLSFSSVCCQFSWRVDMRGRDIALYIFFYGIL